MANETTENTTPAYDEKILTSLVENIKKDGVINNELVVAIEFALSTIGEDGKIADFDIDSLNTLLDSLKKVKDDMKEKTKAIQQAKNKAAKAKTALDKLAWAKENWETNDLVVYYYATGRRYMIARFVEFKEKTAHLEIAKCDATSTGKTRRNVGYDKIECMSVVDFFAEDPDRIAQYAKSYKELAGHDITDDFVLEEATA